MKTKEEIVSYLGFQKGDRVLVSATVADVTETGEEILVLERDSEGYVIARKEEE